MPGYRGHLVGGVITYAVTMQVLKYAQPNAHVILQGLVCCLLGSLFPDVDVKSKGQKVFYYLLLSFLLYCLFAHKWRMFVMASVLGVTPLLVRHRGIFHEVWFLLLVTLAMMVAVTSLQKAYEPVLLSNCFFFFAGCLSHVFLDRFLSKVKRVL